ncbi:MAG TPA: hypothetical protein VJQ47_13930 [Steroidobacteraceae bacterium]|nr:hypothetical protein [Steroidobacteraceae bacterium]
MTLLARPLYGLALFILVTGLASAAASPLPFAHSAQLIIEVTPADQALLLHIGHARGGAPVVSDDVRATIDGRSVTATRQSDGSYQLPVDLQAETDVSLDVIVAHDGIREILSGKLTLPQKSHPSAWAEHKQIAWWILNIGVVLVAAIALQRRGGSSEQK